MNLQRDIFNGSLNQGLLSQAGICMVQCTAIALYVLLWSKGAVDTVVRKGYMVNVKIL